ncbi:biopolymer transporter ExbD [Helicobacter pylori]|jgi:TonB system transport protein ExbD, group 2|uniref:Biopolymer transport protein ExbD n=4 Tax=Helicobacter pylori TaxID=210 RepID=EXBD_HELPY|nr:TonB system transport protein ExbD [Helicobacter pylori]O25898.1 RecName: Full=Biopolymer transport protein ExbD [Helicobacter pylori 26695]ACJ08455.1 biopolymer transport protein ExbD [Helicobacter pylori P12]AAD08382.1 biopolymer transport protein (exbD) [Helicobacter pylori 26695]ACI28036.1 biopolymer transport protein [Helicobacter pylori G27]AFV42558.1 biopolymer transport protein [Helicobacter pylori 26695]AFV44153.1 biopolymer transport protein [Helicobacter pylori Rif1]
MKSIRRGDGLNVVPFIDIMLVLLAIVLSISTFIAQGKIKVSLPNAKNAEKSQPNDQKVVVISVDEHDNIFVDDKPMNLEALSAVVKQTDPKTLIDLKSDKSSRFETFISIMDILKEHNHENFSISTQAQ